MAKAKRDPANPGPTYGGGGSPECTRTVTIRLANNGITNHRQYVNRGNCVQWRDQTGIARVLTFYRWPFTEVWQNIAVPASGYSNVFHVAPGVPNGDYPYMPDPPIPVGPPDPPLVIVGD